MKRAMRSPCGISRSTSEEEFGGGGGIRTHGALSARRFSRPVLSAAQPPHLENRLRPSNDARPRCPDAKCARKAPSRQGKGLVESMSIMQPMLHRIAADIENPEDRPQFTDSRVRGSTDRRAARRENARGMDRTEALVGSIGIAFASRAQGSMISRHRSFQRRAVPTEMISSAPKTRGRR